MPKIIIPASKSLTISDRFPTRNINNCILPIGNDGFFNYISCLFFNISSIPCNAFICYAELVLFRVDNFYNNPVKPLGISQLNECFSNYTSLCNYPKINSTLTKVFYPPISKTFVRIPITSFVKLWLRNYSINNCIMLYGKNKKVLVNFASAICTKKYLVPFLKITYFPYCNNISTLRKIHVTGTIAAQSKYNSVVNIGVSRDCSHLTDNYYVAEEFDNSNSDSPLHINKTYKIAIIPRKTIGDVETVTFYGSYKE